MPYKKIISENRKAFFDYHILETYEAGIVLKGNEVKSLRIGAVNLRDSFARGEKGEIWLYGMHISPYKFSRREEVDPLRKRKLLLKKSEIKKLIGRTSEKGLALIPTKLYFFKNYAKIEIGVAKGKKQYDKRETIKKKDLDRDMQRELTAREG